MKLAVFMDAWHTLHPQKDTTVAIIERAQSLGFDCVFFTDKDLYAQGGQAYARVQHLHLNDLSSKRWAEAHVVGDVCLHEMDIILVRKDPPLHLNYLYALHTLELAEKDGVLIANKPQGVRDANEKMFTLHFSAEMSPTLVTANIERLQAFWAEHRDVVFKPLDGMGGKNIFHVGDDGKNLAVILDMLTESESIAIMAQRFIPAIHTDGDKRIILINGQPIPYALARFPKALEFRGNLAAGGHGKVVPLTSNDLRICKRIGPILRNKGLWFVGMDVIGDYLTEINVTSPTCVREITAETGLDITGDYLQALCAHLSF